MKIRDSSTRYWSWSDLVTAIKGVKHWTRGEWVYAVGACLLWLLAMGVAMLMTVVDLRTAAFLIERMPADAGTAWVVMLALVMFGGIGLALWLAVRFYGDACDALEVICGIRQGHS